MQATLTAIGGMELDEEEGRGTSIVTDQRGLINSGIHNESSVGMI